MPETMLDKAKYLDKRFRYTHETKRSLFTPYKGTLGNCEKLPVKVDKVGFPASSLSNKGYPRLLFSYFYHNFLVSFS